MTTTAHPVIAILPLWCSDILHVCTMVYDFRYFERGIANAI